MHFNELNYDLNCPSPVPMYIKKNAALSNNNAKTTDIKAVNLSQHEV